MKLRIFVKERAADGDKTTLFEILRDHCLIGRKQADLHLSDPSCSRQHALIYSGPDGRLRIKDLESRNGTNVRGRTIADCSLRIGDEIRIGDALLVVIGYEPGQRPVESALAEGPVTKIREVNPFQPASRPRESRNEESHTTLPRVTSQWPDHEASTPKKRPTPYVADGNAATKLPD